MYQQHPKTKKLWNMFVFICDLPPVKTALVSLIDEQGQEWSLLKDGGIGVVILGVQTFPSVYLDLEIDDICVDLEFSGDLVEEKEREITSYYEHEHLNGLQYMYSPMGYIAPNSYEEGALEFEKLPDE